MQTHGIPMACARSATLRTHAAQAPGLLGQRSSGGMDRFSIRALHLARSTSAPVIPSFSPTDGKNCLLGKRISASRSERLESERSSLSRLDVELMLRRMVRAEEEKSEKAAGEEPDNTNDSGHQLWINGARNLQTSAQIFCSMMFWIIVFFVTSMWDSDKPVRYRRRDRGRRK